MDFKEKVEANSSFAKQVDCVLLGADTTSTHLKVMSTPLILRQLGASNLPILMTAKHMKNIVANKGNDENVNYHGLGDDIVKRLPELIADPVMVMDSLTRDDSIVVLTSAVDKENRPIIGAIKFDGIGNLNNIEISANILTSVYGRNNFNDFIQRNISAGTILYWDKEKSKELIKTPGIQFPDNLNSLATNIIIRKAKAFVNIFDKNNKDQFKQYEQCDKADHIQSNKQVDQAKQAKWLDIDLKKESIVKEYGQNTMIKVPNGEYDSFEFLAPTKLVKRNGKKGSIKLSVRSDWNYELKHNGLSVELNGIELYSVFDGKEIGKVVKRIEPTYRNNRKLENIKENLPEEMKNIPNWCVYKIRDNEERDMTIYSPNRRNIQLKEKQLEKSGQYIKIKLIEGKYVDFEFSVPAESIKKDENSNAYNLPIKLDGQYQLNNNATIAKLSGRELCNEFRKVKLNQASIDDTGTWSSFDAAMEYAKIYNCDGLAFAIDGASGISCVDLKNCIAANGKLNGKDSVLEEGTMNKTAYKMIGESNGYCETSVSGDGLHFFFKDDILSQGKYKNKAVLDSGDEIDVYDNKKFIAITGNIRSNTNELARCPSAMASWLRDKLGAKVTEQDKSKLTNIKINQNADISDSAVIERIKKSKKGQLFEDLFRGGSLADNNSIDDFRLLNILAYFTNRDEKQMARIFKESALYRPEKENYLGSSIKQVCCSVPSEYADNRNNGQKVNRQSNGHK